MKLNLSLKDDAELRKEIRNIILGQVTSITREEIKGQLESVVDTVLNQGFVSKIVQQRVIEVIRVDNLAIRDIISSVVEKIVQTLTAKIELEFSKKVESLTENSINELVEKTVKKVLKSKLG